MSYRLKAPPATIWITGLSAAGKTTLATALFNELKNTYSNVEFWDGEFLREKAKNLNYSTRSRCELAFHNAQLCIKANKRGKCIVITGITHKAYTRRKIRGIFHHYLEIFLQSDVQTCASRDFKGNYEKALRGEYDNFIGVTEPYEEYEEYDFKIETNRMGITECTQTLLGFVLPRLEEMDQ